MQEIQVIINSFNMTTTANNNLFNTGRADIQIWKTHQMSHILAPFLFLVDWMVTKTSESFVRCSL